MRVEYGVGAGVVLLLVWLYVNRNRTVQHDPGFTSNPGFMTNIQPTPKTIRGNIMAPGGGTFI